MKLVRGQREGRHFEFAKIERQLADGLHGVEVERNAKPVAARGKRADVLDHSRFVVREDDGGQFQVGPREVVQPLVDDPACGVDVEKREPPAAAFERTAGFARRRVLGRSEQNRTGLFGSQAENGQIDRLGAAARKDHFAGPRSEDRRDLLPRVFERATGGTPFGMTAAGVGEILARNCARRRRSLPPTAASSSCDRERCGCMVVRNGPASVRRLRGVLNPLDDGVADLFGRRRSAEVGAFRRAAGQKICHRMFDGVCGGLESEVFQHHTG